MWLRGSIYILKFIIITLVLVPVHECTSPSKFPEQFIQRDLFFLVLLIQSIVNTFVPFIVAFDSLLIKNLRKGQ